MQRRKLWIGGVALVAGVMLAPVAPASAVAPRSNGEPAPMTLTALTVSPPTVAVTGFGAVAVTISATLDLQGSTVASCSDTPGDDGRFGGAVVTASLRRVDRPLAVPESDGAGSASVPLTTMMPAPAATSGTWTGTWRVAATRGGTWVVTEVHACLSRTMPLAGSSRNVTAVAVGTSPTLLVSASGAPRITARVIPSLWPRPPVIAVTVTRAGRPIVGRPVLFSSDLGCAWDSGVLVPTNAAGVAYRTIRDPFVQCWRVTTPPAADAKIDTRDALMAGGNPTRRWLFTTVAVVKPTTASRGSMLLVSGAVTPTLPTLRKAFGSAGAVATLQRLSGRSGWRTVAVATVRDPARFTLRWVPPTAGRVVLRVGVSGYGGEAASPWATFGPNRTAPWTVAVRAA